MLLETGHLGEYASSNQALGAHEIPAVAAETDDDDDDDNNNNNNNNNEMREHLDDNGFAIGRGTPIQDFYAGQSIFITGGTGFLGKILIEKLLRSCQDISTIYLLMRGKKDRNIEDRMEDIFNDSLYNRLREESPKFRHKLVAVSGDCSLPGLGLCSDDRERLVQEVSIVFHSAATVRFDEKISTALAINVGSTSEMLDLCKHMERLKAFIHVSTAYANVQVTRIEETLYPHPETYESLCEKLKDLNDDEMDKLTRKILGKWPNTYTYTKALAEKVVRQKSEGLSVAIFRPAIVISSAFEPVSGWIDNFYGPTGAVAATASGILRSMYCPRTTKANIVPVDFTVNALIASAWDVALRTERRVADDMLVYNYVSTVEKPITWSEYCDINLAYGLEYPLSRAKWLVSLKLQNSRVIDSFYRAFLHYLPALLFDFVCICRGKPPMLWKAYKKIDKFVGVLQWFVVSDWIFSNDNVRAMWQRLDTKDKRSFRFSIQELDWTLYFRNYMKGIRVYLLKDDTSTLEMARKRMKGFQRIHEIVKALLFAVLLFVVWEVVGACVF